MSTAKRPPDSRSKPSKTSDIPLTCPPPSKPKPSLMDQLPKPSGSWDEEIKNKSGNKNLILALGALLLSASGFLVYKQNIDIVSIPILKKDDPIKPKKVNRKSRRPLTIPKYPSSSSLIPSEVQYLLVGGGTASFAAFRAIKSRDPKAQVLFIGNEPYFPYLRPPLSKEMFYSYDPSSVKKLNFKQWNGTERSIFFEPEDFYTPCEELKSQENGGVAIARGWTVTRIDADKRQATLDDGKVISYDKCLIATGAKPKTHPVFADLDNDLKEKVSLYRNIIDYEELSGIIEDGAKSIAVIGGSFLGSELACALARRGRNQHLEVVQVFKEGGSMGRILPDYLSRWTTNKVSNEGVKIIASTKVEDIDLDKGKVVLSLNNGKELRVDHVVLAVGVEPNTELAKTSDLETDKKLGGFLVNSELQARSNLYVAGDCACFFDSKLGRRRVEHHDHAVVSGRLAGENMTGAGKPYTHQSMFWSDLGPDVGFEAIGIVDSELPTVGVYAKMTKKDKPKSVSTAAGDGMRSEAEEEVNDPAPEKKASENLLKNKTTDDEDYGKGVIFYLRNDIVVGILLWNVFNRMSIARQVLKEEKKFEDLNEVAKLFNIHKN